MSADSMEIHELHRWLNPFARQRAEMVTPRSPQEIEAALRPELVDTRWQHLPFYGYFGRLESSGFVLEQAPFGLPVLTARYEPSGHGTRLELTVGRHGPALLAWFWHIVVMPVLVVANAIRLYLEGFDVTPPDALGLGVVSVLIIVLVPAMIYQYIIQTYRHRDDLDSFMQTLAESIDAREVRPSE